MRTFPVLGAIAAPLLIAAAAASGATARPDLVASAPRATSANVSPGGTLTVADRVRNAGHATAGRSTTRLSLSVDRTRSSADLALGRRSIRALAAGKASAARRGFTVPPTTRAGRYYVIACADGGHAVRERSERNNCRASATPVTVAAATPVPSPPPEQPASTDPAPTTAPPAPAPPDGGSPAPAPTNPPGAPTGVTATPGSTGNVSLTWNAVTGATGYRVFRADASGGPYTQIAAPTGTSYNDTGRADSQRYYYVVQAVNDGGASPNNSEVSALACVDTTSDSAASPLVLSTLAHGFSTSYSASICRGDADWIQVSVNNNQASFKLEAGTYGSSEPGEPGHLRLDVWDGGAASTTGPALISLNTTTGTPRTATTTYPSGIKTFLMKVAGYTTTAGNSYKVTVSAP